MTAGRPSALDKELSIRIKKLILEGKNYKETAEIIEIPYDTFLGWVEKNYEGFGDLMVTYRHERMLRKAEKNIEDYADMKAGELKDPKWAKVHADVNIFIAETLGRTNYHKKKEVDQFNQFDFEISDEDTTKKEIEPVSGATAGVAQTDTPSVGSESV